MRRATFLIGAVLLAALLVPSIFQPEKLLFQRDLLDFFLPMKAAWARSMAGGDVPWWDPFTEGGQPFFATLQSQVLYPPNLLFLSGAPLSWCLSAFVAAHLAWAGLGGFALARELGARPVAAALAGVAIEAGGFMVSLADLLNQACSQAWMPWVFLMACRHGRTRSLASLAGWSAACAMSFLAGEPQYAALAGAASCALAWARARQLGAPRPLRVVAGAALAALLALLACAVQIVPLAELVARSTRAASSFAEGGRHALEPAGLLALVRAPAGPFGGPAGALVESLHVGIIVLVLALVGALRRRDALARMLVLATLVSIALALGPHLPLLGRLQVEATSFLRYPVKDFCVAAVLLPVLAALGAESLLASVPASRARAGAIVACALLAIATADLWRAQRVLLPALPARELLAPTPLIELLQRETSPDGPRVHATPLTRERMDRRARRVLDGDLAGAMRERVELLEGALPMYFSVSATWGGTALPPRRQEELLQAASGPLTPEQVAALRAGWLLDSSARSLPLPRVPVEGGAAVLYELGPAARPSRQWRGPNVAVGPKDLPPPSDWPGWREGPPGTWRFRPTGLVPLSILSATAWLALLVLAWRRDRAPASI